MEKHTCDFSYEHYSQILDVFLDMGYTPSLFEDGSPEGKFFLRHDIDVNPWGALALAEIEAKKGIKSTFFIQINSPFYNPYEESVRDIFYRISKLGHEFGLHFHIPGIEKMDIEQVRLHAQRDLEITRSLVPVSIKNVVSLHRPKREFLGRVLGGNITSVYEPRFFEKIKYISDSRGIWREGCPCGIMKNTKEGEKTLPPGYQILTHPIWWTEDGSLTHKERVSRFFEKRKKVFGESFPTQAHLVE